MGGLSKVFGDVSGAAVGISGFQHTVCGGFRWPQAKTVVVLDNGDAALHAGLFGCFEPLARIGLGCRSEHAF